MYGDMNQGLTGWHRVTSTASNSRPRNQGRSMSTDSGDSVRRDANRRDGTARTRLAAGGHVDVIDELDSIGSEYHSTLSHNDEFAPHNSCL